MGTNFAVAPGEYLQEWIDGNGMSVGEFAVELGVTVAEIEDLLTGKKPSGGKLPVSSNGSPLFHLTAGSGSS